MDPGILDAADYNFLQSNTAFMGTSRLGETLESDHVQISSCGAPNASFNRAHVKLPVRDLEAAVRRGEAYFGPRKLPFRVTLRSDAEPAHAEAMAALGWRRAALVPAMVLSPIRDGSRPQGALTIEPVRTAADLEGFRGTAWSGFGLPAGAAPAYLTDRLAARADVRLYVGRVQGRPVATSCLLVTNEVAGVYWVATLADARGRGFGEAITWAAVRGGIQAGCRFASLQASDLGRPVYERMGFATPVHYVHYEKG